MTTADEKSPQNAYAVLAQATKMPGAKPPAVVAAALVRGITVGYSRGLVLKYLRDRGDEGITAVLDNRSLLQKISDDAKKLVKDSSTREGQLRLLFEVVRNAIAKLLSPAPLALAPRSAQRARMALAVVTSSILQDEKQWKNAFLNYPQVGLMLGVEPSTAGRSLKNAVGSGWLRVVKRLESNAVRYAVPYSKPELLGGLWTVAEQVAAVAVLYGAEDRDAVKFGRALSLLQHASHPAWGYSVKDPARPSRAPVSHLTWLVAFADALGVNPTAVFAISSRGVAQHRLMLKGMGLAEDVRFVGKLLDEFAVSTGAMTRYQEAKAERELAAAERTVQVQLRQEAKAAARAAVKSMLDSAGRVPKELDELSGWGRKMKRVFHIDVDDPLHVLARKDLRDRIVRAGYSRERAEVAADVIAPTRLTPLVLRVGAIPSADADSDSRNEWGRKMRDLVDALPLTEEQREALRVELRRKLRGLRYTQSQAREFAAMILRKRESVTA